MASCLKSNMGSFQAGSDLSAKQFFAVKFSGADSQVNLAGVGNAIGILMNKPLSGEVAEVALSGGGAKSKCVGNVTRGDSLKADASGNLIPASAGDRAIAIAESSGVSGDVIAVIVDLHMA